MLSDSALLSRLVGFDTTSRNSNLELADFLCDYVDGTARVTRQPSQDGEKANLILAFGPEGTDREGLVLSGHMDTVPAEEPGWKSDPFTLTDRGDDLVGRGSCDMKGFLAVATNVAMETKNLKKPLVLVFTYDEEVGTLGARHLAEHWADAGALPRSAIIGEPTSMRVIRLHKGHVKMKRQRIAVGGVPAHSGLPAPRQERDRGGGARARFAARPCATSWSRPAARTAEFFPEVAVRAAQHRRRSTAARRSTSCRTAA